MITYTYKNGKTKTYKSLRKEVLWGAIGHEIESMKIDNVVFNNVHDINGFIALLNTAKAGMKS